MIDIENKKKSIFDIYLDDAIKNESSEDLLIANVNYCNPRELEKDDNAQAKSDGSNKNHMKALSLSGKYEKQFDSDLSDESSSDSDGYFLHAEDGRKFSIKECEVFRNILKHRPTVYIVYYFDDEEGKWVSYVGETNHIIQRTVEHVANYVNNNESSTSKKKENYANEKIVEALNKKYNVRQYVIWHRTFNKSITLDIENTFIDYMQSIPDVICLNGRTNAQKGYYTDSIFKYLVSKIWKMLGSDDQFKSCKLTPNENNKQCSVSLFPLEEHIWQSELYKISPFHSLGPDQSLAFEYLITKVKQLLDDRNADSNSKLFLVQGAAGTGKSILISALFYELCSMLSDEKSVKLLVYNTELLNEYQRIVKNLSYDDKSNNDVANVVLNPSKFIHAYTEGGKSVKNEKGRWQRNYSKISGKADVVLIDEAHLLFTMGQHGYQGKNQLHDILRRAKIVIAVFDPRQIVSNAAMWSRDQLRALGLVDKKEQTNFFSDPRQLVIDEDSYEVVSLVLRQQFRISASPEIESWISKFTEDNAKLDNYIPTDNIEDRDTDGVYSGFKDIEYEIKVFDSPFDLVKAVDKKRKEIKKYMNKNNKLSSSAPELPDLCRIVATYDWKYTEENGGKVTLYHCDGSWCMPNDSNIIPKLYQGKNNKNVFPMPWNKSPIVVSFYNENNTIIDSISLANARPSFGSVAKKINPPSIDGKTFIGCFDDQSTLIPSDKVLDDDLDVYAHYKDSVYANRTYEYKSSSHKRKSNPWVFNPDTECEIGSYFTVQGFDLNCVGVIIGPSVSYDEDSHKIIFIPDYSCDRNINSSEYFLRNQLNVLLTRGVHALYLFAVDKKLQNFLKSISNK